jgi:UDP-N-acetylmuramoyl-tripeptide--D-alanyl-D-alanine ligase
MEEAKQKLLDLFCSGHKACIDSRLLSANNLFFALKGETFNGNLFANQALENGASMVVVDEEIPLKTDKVLKVNSVLETLQETSKAYRNLFAIPVIGITGTNGKTTTKELISAVLSCQFNTLSTSGNLNNHIGVPLTILELEKSHQMAVIEMGANHVGEIGFLSSIANPDYGLITNVGKAHIEGFGSPENIITAKTELYKHIIRKEGAIFVNGGNTILTEKAKGANLILYGTESYNHLQGKAISNGPRLSFNFKVIKPFGKAQVGSEGTVHSKLVGDYNLENFLAAISIGLYFGIHPTNAVKALEDYTPANNRSQLVETASNTVILDAYNANPTSMNLALKNLKSIAGKKKAAIIGDMLELGDTSLDEHKKILNRLRDLKLNVNIVVGEHFFKAAKGLNEFLAFENVDQATAWLKANKINNHTVLVKGSRGIKMEKVMDYI